MNYNEPKPGDVIAIWPTVAPYKCDEAGPADTRNGDNPSFSEGPQSHLGGSHEDNRIKETSGANPVPGKIGA